VSVLSKNLIDCSDTICVCVSTFVTHTISLKNQYAVVAAFANTRKFAPLVIHPHASLAISEPNHIAFAMLQAVLSLTMLHKYQKTVHNVPSHVYCTDDCDAQTVMVPAESESIITS